MENKKTIRNPFPWIGKVFKYETMHSSRILVPIYIAIIALALITGLFVPVSSEGGLDFNFSFVINENGGENWINGLAGFFFMIYWIIIIVSGVVTISVISKRFKHGLLGDEAYLNLSLPVTMGEHLWGRILTMLLWSVVSMVVMLISFIALCIKNLSIIHFEEGWLTTLAGFILFAISWGICIHLFTYLINAIGHLSKKHRTMVKLIAIIGITSITSRITGEIMANWLPHDVIILYWLAFIGLIFSVIYGFVTYFIMQLRLNLE